MNRYKQQFHDSPRTMEHQLQLITSNAKKLAEVVSKVTDMLSAIQDPSMEEDEIRCLLLQQMQATNRRILETDIFMSGYQIKEHS